MAFSICRGKSALPFGSSSSSLLLVFLRSQSHCKHRSWSSSSPRSSSSFSNEAAETDDDVVAAGSSGISRPLSEILKELNKKVPESVVKTRLEDGFAMKYIPWHIVNRIMNLHAPEWSGEVRSITYSADGKTVSVVYRVTLYGTDAELHIRALKGVGIYKFLVAEELEYPINGNLKTRELYRESTGTASVADTNYGDPIQKAEAMAFRRACARFGLGLHLYHEDMS